MTKEKIKLEDITKFIHQQTQKKLNTEIKAKTINNMPSAQYTKFLNTFKSHLKSYKDYYTDNNIKELIISFTEEQDNEHCKYSITYAKKEIKISAISLTKKNYWVYNLDSNTLTLNNKDIKDNSKYRIFSNELEKAYTSSSQNLNVKKIKENLK
mgnify:CR=1 FL=1